MNGTKVAGILYAEFRHDQFLTRDIPARAMQRLGKAMGVVGAGQSLKIKVGQALSNMEGREYALPCGKKVAMGVKRPENKNKPCRFWLLPATGEAGAGPTAQRLAFDVVLTDSGEGYSVSCPALLGCHTQGLTEVEALENVREAIAGWLIAEARAVKIRTQKMVDEYNAAGYSSRVAVVSVLPVDEWHFRSSPRFLSETQRSVAK